MSNAMLYDPIVQPSLTPKQSQKRRRHEQIEQFNLALGKTILRLRRELDMSQEELAHEVGLSTSYMSRIETGGVNPTLGALRPLIRFFGLTWDQFMKLADATDEEKTKFLEEWDLAEPFLKKLVSSLKGKAISTRTKNLLQFVVNQELTTATENE